jgi:hypothetical protein
MELKRRQRRALEAICDTLAPGGDGLPSASELGVPDALLEAAEVSLREADQKQLGQLLSFWDVPIMSALAGGGLERFSTLPQETRERILLSWCDSRIPQRRAAFQALRKAVLYLYYMLPAPRGGRSPIWDDIGYPGPLGPPSDPPAKTLTPLRVGRDTTLDCDVCVVGSGAGGGTAAGVLASAGLDVVVLEAGDYYDDEDFDGAELSGYQRMYLQGGAAATHDHSVGLLAGACLGGGTVVNLTTSLRTPDDVRAEWAAFGASAIASDEFTRSLDAVCERLGVNSDHSRASRRDELFRQGLEALGWHIDAMPRNVRGCDQGENCGYCWYGCRLGAKQSTAKTWLADAQAAGARILVRTRASRVRVEAGKAVGVEAQAGGGHRVAVRSRAVVAACGAIHTPALLKRSGLENANVGRHLRLHPATPVFGVFDEEIAPWHGTVQARYSDQHRHLDDGYGIKYETVSFHPSLAVAFVPWRSARLHRELMRNYPRLNGVGVFLRDRDGGEVRVGRDGEPVARYRLSDRDIKHVRIGIEGAARIMEAAGARRIVSGHTRLVAYEPGRIGERERFLRDADA